MFNNHLMKACLAAVFAIGLAACSSSSDNGTDTSTPTDPPPPTQTEQDLETLKNQIAALREQLGIDDTADIGTTIAELQTTLKDLQDKAAALVTAADVMAAEALFAGIGDATDLTVAVGTDGNNGVADEDGGGGMAAVTVTGLTPGVDGDDVVKSAEPMLGTWQGTMLTDAIADDADTDPGTSSTVVVYTDIEAPEAVPFGEVYDLDANGNLANADVILEANRPKVKASEFVHTGRKNHDPDADSATDVAVVMGSFNGASGEYRCLAGTPTACASHDAGDGVVRLEGAWLFDPDPRAMAMMADASFAYFGWWLNKGTTEGVEAGVFHGVTDLTGEDAQLAVPGADDGFDALGGTATYGGSAAGQYAINPGLSAASGGHWTADATLTADFGAADAAGMISGTVNNFMAGGEMMNWSVALGETALTTETGAFDSGANATDEETTAVAGDDVVWTIGGVDGAESGSWEGDLYAPGDNNVPTVATGMFTATHGTVGHMIGHRAGLQ